MKTPDALLGALWVADEPPARDDTFVILVMERAERRHLAWDIASLVPVAFAAGAVLWASSPAILDGAQHLLTQLSTPGSAVIACGLLLAGWVWVLGNERDTAWI